ncbi:MAG TPA: hypothetical protein PKA80_08765 [Ignavibacteriaceae bacterium]|nr:hypothetical protein [Ignavibacteriaceae bacterium]
MKLLSIVKKILNKMLIDRNIPKSIGTKVIAVIILIMITLAFLHSETGLFAFDGDNHGTHDYCEIVKNSNTHSNIVRIEPPKLEYNKDICFHCSEKFEAQALQPFFEIKDQNLKANCLTDLYLFNSTFLI